jgi:glycosyltransferase involved in cell wall biosynthesis
MLNAPKISVIIPTYRHRDFILRTLDSVFAQTLLDYEIIVINDGSPDDTGNVLAPLIAAGRIQYLEQKNQGQSRARNCGLERARGKYIAFLDDDDLWPPDKLEWQMDFLEKNPGVALVGGVFQMIDEMGNMGTRWKVYPDITFESLFLANPFISPGQTLIRTDVLKELGGMNVTIWGADDWDLWFRTAKKSRIVMQDRMALYYRDHPGNASKQTARLLKACCLTINLHLQAVPQKLRKNLRHAAYRTLYWGLGMLLVETAKKRLRRGRLIQASKLLAGLEPLADGLFFDPELRARFIHDLVKSPLKRLFSR